MIGRVYLHKNFPVEAGETSPKRFIVINNPQDEENWIVVKTTSSITAANTKLRPRTGTCHLSAINVYRLEPNQDPIFEKETWIQFYVVYELKIAELRKHFSSGNIEGKGKINKELFLDVLKCLSQSEDISGEHLEHIQRSIEALEA